MKNLMSTFLFGVLMTIGMTSNAATIYYDNGASLYVPESGWTVRAEPNGFNNLPYGPSNPKGKLPGWGGWPEYDDGCSDELTVGGSAVCAEKPYFITGPQVAPKECITTDELVVGGSC